MEDSFFSIFVTTKTYIVYSNALHFLAQILR